MEELENLYIRLSQLTAQRSLTDSIALAALEGEDVSVYGDIHAIRHSTWLEIVALKEQIAEQERKEDPEQEREQWSGIIGHYLEHGRIIADGENLYSVITPHIAQADWKPSLTPALFRPYSEDKWPDWVQPTGAHDAYKKGDKVSHNDKHWISDVDGNVWEPSIYGWTEAE